LVHKVHQVKWNAEKWKGTKNQNNIKRTIMLNNSYKNRKSCCV
jgi:hypothetical protein